MNSNNTNITIEEILQIKSLFSEIYDENLRPRIKGDVFNQKIKRLNDYVYSEKIGLPRNTTPKQIEIKLEQLYENLIKLPKFQDQSPNDVNKNNEIKSKTLRSDEIENLQKTKDLRDEQIRTSKEKANADIRNFEERNKEIYEEKQRLNEFLEKSSRAKEELKKVGDVYLKVEAAKVINFSEDENSIFENYKNSAINDPEVSTIKLAREIHANVDSKLEATGLSTDDIDTLVNMTAQRSVENWIESKSPNYIAPAAYVAINDTVSKNVPKSLDPETQVTVLEAIKANNLYKYQSDLVYKNVLKSALGENVADATFGSEYKILVSSTQDNVYTHKYNFSDVVESSRQIYSERIRNIDSILGLGRQETQSYLFNQSAAYFAKSSTGKVILRPNSNAEMLFFSTFKNAGKTVTWTGTGAFGNIIAKSGYAPLVNLVTGTKFVTPVITQAAKVAGQAAVKVAVKTGVSASLATTLSATFGTAVPIIGNIVGFIIGWVGGKIIDKLPQIKKWLSKNSIPLGVVAGFGGAVVFGAGPGVIIGLGFITFAGGLAPFLMATMGILGYIGSSLAITIATPVIIAFLTLPPLIAFIMLVINNSAYIVPPSLNESSIGKITSPYIDITKTASPAGPLKNEDLPETITYTVKITAKKGNLTNVKITDRCEVISRNSVSCPDFTIPEAPASISPSAPFVFTYTAAIDSKFRDAVAINTIVVTADALEQSGATAEVSNSLTIGNPPISCPVPGAKPDNSMNYSYNSSNDTGHGSKPYWTAMGSSYSYALPQSTGCMRPGDCPYYGYAYDVFPNGTTEVFAPTVLGKDVTWNCSYAFSNGGGRAGYTYHCTSTDGKYLLVLTHINKNAKTGTIKSGEKIGSLFNQQGNTHLHLEFQLDGKWQKPENYFCK